MPASCGAAWRPSTTVTAVTATSASAARATRMPMRWRNLTGAFTSLHPDHLCLARIGVGGQVGDRTRVGEHIGDRGGGRVGLGGRHALAREDLLVPVDLELRPGLLQDLVRGPLAH